MFGHRGHNEKVAPLGGGLRDGAEILAQIFLKNVLNFEMLSSICPNAYLVRMLTKLLSAVDAGVGPLARMYPEMIGYLVKGIKDTNHRIKSVMKITRLS